MEVIIQIYKQSDISSDSGVQLECIILYTSLDWTRFTEIYLMTANSNMFQMNT